MENEIGKLQSTCVYGKMMKIVKLVDTAKYKRNAGGRGSFEPWGLESNINSNLDFRRRMKGGIT